MDLTGSTKRNSQQKRQRQPRSLSLDDDDTLSNNSSSSLNVLLAAASDSESQSPISVRDMIKRYDTAAKLGPKGGSRHPQLHQTHHKQQQQQYGLPAMKSAYFGVNQFGTHSTTNRFPLRQYVAQVQQNTGSKWTQTQSKKSIHSGEHNNNNTTKSSCKLSDNTFMTRNNADATEDGWLVCERHASVSDSENVYIADHTERSSRSPAQNLNEVSCNLQEITSGQRTSSEVVEGIEEANPQPVETSYHSKTTIAKTAGGVRIIIDIFFDQEHQPVSATEVVGSRVETDIPQSRILNEFQQQAAAQAQLTRN
ncbi:uncharacterized protein LOC129249881 [Anastrepha obliqua]|uniref:uncharacterized protein LOC129249881 n=1 Tax=Anastrepha obliqua TaxID=95512 RepID=UPI00240A5BCD|nr:uncharacterized protein LOC129249881 [Anastrepha obliqua]